MATVDELLEKFDEAKALVRAEMRETFINDDGTLKVADGEFWNWIGDRAIDELKVAMQLAHILANHAHLLPPGVITDLSTQLADESRHYAILRALLPTSHLAGVDDGVARIPESLESDKHWQSLCALADSGDPFAALIDINIVHEGYSAAAIEELRAFPNAAVRDAYERIGDDEGRHHASGRELLRELLSLSKGTASEDATNELDGLIRGGEAEWSAFSGGSLAQIVGGAHHRQKRGCSSQWSWPPPVPDPPE